MTSESPTGIKKVSRYRVEHQASPHEELDNLIEERAVAFVYNGISHAVMMATPMDLDDFALGFSYTEGIITSPQDILDIESRPCEQGIEVELEVTSRTFEQLKTKRRTLSGKSGCGLCGVESLHEALFPIKTLIEGPYLDRDSLHRAKEHLEGHQCIRQDTGSAHAAAFCKTDGEIVLVREDVGRHNALDKLVGALLKRGDFEDGFIIVTSRASYEIVSKVITLGVPILACVSAPTSSAVEQAELAGLTLVRYLSSAKEAVYTAPHRIVSSLGKGIS